MFNRHSCTSHIILLQYNLIIVNTNKCNPLNRKLRVYPDFLNNSILITNFDLYLILSLK